MNKLAFSVNQNSSLLNSEKKDSKTFGDLWILMHQIVINIKNILTKSFFFLLNLDFVIYENYTVSIEFYVK